MRPVPCDRGGRPVRLVMEWARKRNGPRRRAFVRCAIGASHLACATSVEPFDRHEGKTNMTTVTGELMVDARVIPLPQSATQPSFSLLQWLSNLVDGKALSERWSARQQASALRDLADGMRGVDPRFAADLSAAADMHEQRHDR